MTFSAVNHAVENPTANGTDSRPPFNRGDRLPRFDDLNPDVPAYRITRVPAAQPNPGASPGAADVIVVMSPRASPSNAASGARPEPEIASPELMYQTGGEETAQDERLCIQVWTLCAALWCPLVLSAWLLVVPYMVKISGAIRPGVEQEFTLATYASSARPVSTAMTASFSTSITVTPPATTTDVWNGVNQSCLTPPVINVPPSRLRVGPQYPRRPPFQPTRPFFCAYDNNQVGGPQTQWHFAFESLPFALCPHVMYWSVGVVNGSLTSRMINFDQQHGLHQLRNITDRQGFPHIKIILTLGGYREDAPHFLRLGRDPATMQRLMRSVTDAMRDYRLDGVNVDWVEPRPGCGSSDDMRVLSLLLRKLRESFNQTGMLQKLVAFMTPAVRGYGPFVDDVADVVDYFFLGKGRLPPPGPVHSPAYCTGVTDDIHMEIQRYAVSAPRVNLAQLCIIEEAGLLTTFGNMNTVTGAVTTEIPVYTSSIRDFCNRADFCRNDTIRGSCVPHFAFVQPPGGRIRRIAYVAVSSAATLKARTNYSAIRAGSPPPGTACVLAVRLHADNYGPFCSATFRQYLLTEHLYYGTLGLNITGGSILDAAPAC